MPVKITCSHGHIWEIGDDPYLGPTIPCPICDEPVLRPSADKTVPLVARKPQAPVAIIATRPPDWEQSTQERRTSPCDPAQTLTAGELREEVPGYELLAEIGRGGMGVVWRARHLGFDREVALKFLNEKHDLHTLSAQRFLEEARITGQLQHPGIPAAYDVGRLADGRPYLAMKLIRGRTFAELLAERRAGTNYLAIFEAVCQAVGYAHAHRVIHRDLKPSNVMVGAFGEVQVMDWGLAKVL